MAKHQTQPTLDPAQPARLLGEADRPEAGSSTTSASARFWRAVQGRTRPWMLPAATVIGLLVVVEILSVAVVKMEQLPAVTVMLKALTLEITSGQFWAEVGRTVYTWAAGSLIATLIAVPLGLLIAASNFVYRSTRLVIDFLRPIPPIAILPLAVLVLGTGEEMVIYLVVFSALWPTLFQTISGAHDVDPVARDTSRAYGLGAVSQYFHVVIPSATPYIATGLRLSTTIALVVTIATELIASGGGLGYRITEMAYAENYPTMYALIFTAGALGWLSTVGFRAVERRALHWHHSHRQEAGK